MSDFKIENELNSMLDDIEKEFEFLGGSKAVSYVLSELQKKDYKKVIQFPYEKMNEALRGIFPTSFIGIGADYGSGKSELAGDIAIHASGQDKNVLLS